MVNKWVIIALVIACGAAFWWQYPDGRLRVIMCDVGQGDSFLIQQAFYQVLVDSGRGTRVLECLGDFLPFWDKKIEVMVVTHPQADHMEGMAEVMRRYQVEVVVANALDNPEAAFDDEFRKEVVDQKTRVVLPKTGKELRLGAMSLKLLWPERVYGNGDYWTREVIEVADYQSELYGVEDLNQVSVAFLLEYGEFQTLFTGDVGEAEEQALLGAGVLTPVEILKVPHHGSKYSSSLGFLRVIRPQAALISAGEGNPHGHPAGESLSRYDAVGAKIYRTDEMGSVVVVTDGRSWWVE